ncbi:MAG: PPC domain-containing protein [Chloroflexi bacterium]|nr:PPC domain-containing protein [Chloroflexota bacterium]
MRIFLKTSFFVLVLMLLSSMGIVVAQIAPTSVQCGQIIEGEFLRADNEGAQEYTLSLAPGDRITVSGDTVGAYLKYAIRVFAPTTGVVASDDYVHRDEPHAESNVLSERGTYTIRVWSNGPGLYTLYIGCTLRDGTVIAPGDVPVSHQVTTSTSASLTQDVPEFGFAGLAPVDFANVARLTIPANVPMTGAITPNGGEILGYLVNGSEGDVLELRFTRLSGNLNLGLIVLSQNNELAFQASLITTNSLITQFTLPSTGEYTVGVFRVDLLPVSQPEPTAFQIQATLNP